MIRTGLVIKKSIGNVLNRLTLFRGTMIANNVGMTMTPNMAIPSIRLKGKVAVVTASTDGIGYAIANRLCAEGASVVISSRKEENVKKAVDKMKDAGCSVTGIVCHVAKENDRKKLMETAVEHFGGIDILVSNAAVNPTVGPVLDCDEDAWDKIFDVNVKSAFMLSKEVLPYLKKRKGGSITYISSIAGFHPFNLHSTPTAKDVALSMIPMNRLAQPEEMAGIVAFLCSSDASYITGETFIAAGGMASRL